MGQGTFKALRISYYGSEILGYPEHIYIMSSPIAFDWEHLTASLVLKTGAEES